MELETLGFDSRYHVEQLKGRPPGKIYEFTLPRKPSSEGGLILETTSAHLFLEVTPFEGESWTGSFACGPEGTTGIFATPCAESVCVVVKGQGFWIPVLSPPSYEPIQVVPIREIFAVPVRQILVFVDHTRLAAYGEDGFLWQTDRLSWDGLKITEVTPELIKGMAWDSPKNREVPFSVNIGSGLSHGGSSPAKYTGEAEDS